MILQNQVRCKRCKAEPYSSHVHDFQYCSCATVAVDGGLEYLRRIGDPDMYEEISIKMDFDLVQKLDECLTNNLNDLGRICAIARTLRDNGYEIIQSETIKQLRTCKDFKGSYGKRMMEENKRLKEKG
jgi:hypothetical protein